MFTELSYYKYYVSIRKASWKKGSYELRPGYLRNKCLKIGFDDHQECLKIMKTFAGSKRYSKVSI